MGARGTWGESGGGAGERRILSNTHGQGPRTFCRSKRRGTTTHEGGPPPARRGPISRALWKASSTGTTLPDVAR